MQNLKLEDVKTELDKTQEELERSQLQLNQLLIELEQSHTQLHQMSREMESVKLQNVKAEENETQEESERSQLQLCQLLMELEQSHTELFQMQRELEESESLKKEMKMELEQTKSQLENTQGELARMQSELDRYKYREAIATQIISERERQYHQFVWDAWYAYRNGDMNQMVDCLQKSLKYTSFSRTKTVSHWVKSWSEFSQQKGELFEVRNLNSIREWKQLLRRMTVVKSKMNSV